MRYLPETPDWRSGAAAQGRDVLAKRQGILR